MCISNMDDDEYDYIHSRGPHGQNNKSLVVTRLGTQRGRSCTSAEAEVGEGIIALSIHRLELHLVSIGAGDSLLQKLYRVASALDDLPSNETSQFVYIHICFILFTFVLKASLGGTLMKISIKRPSYCHEIGNFP